MFFSTDGSAEWIKPWTWFTAARWSRIGARYLSALERARRAAGSTALGFAVARRGAVARGADPRQHRRRRAITSGSSSSATGCSGCRSPNGSTATTGGGRGRAGAAAQRAGQPRRSAPRSRARSALADARPPRQAGARRRRGRQRQRARRRDGSAARRELPRERLRRRRATSSTACGSRRSTAAPGSAKHPKSALQEWAAGNQRKPPEYEVVDRSGPDHAARSPFGSACTNVGEVEATASSKQEAETEAAARELFMESEVRSRAEAMTRCGVVAVIGAPNAGKSTLVNQLVGQKVAIISAKAQTTRARLLGHRARRTRPQIILADTPGIFAPKRRLDRAMVSAAWEGAKAADAIAAGGRSDQAAPPRARAAARRRSRTARAQAAGAQQGRRQRQGAAAGAGAGPDRPRSSSPRCSSSRR